MRKCRLTWPRARLSLELTDALVALADDAPTVLVLEDLQWADPSTLDWLDYATRRPDRAPSRDRHIAHGVGAEAQRSHPRVLGARPAERIELGPLDAAAAAYPRRASAGSGRGDDQTRSGRTAPVSRFSCA
jgi:predicted ATPase